MEQNANRPGQVTIPIYKSPILHFGIGIFLLFWVVSYFVESTFQIDMTQMVRVAIGTAIVIAYVPVCIVAMRKNVPPDRVSQLSIGITLSWGGAVLHALWILLWRYSGQPLWMVNSTIISFFYFIQILGGVMHLTAPGNIDGIVPKHNWINVGVAFGAGVFSASVIFFLKPDFGDFFRLLKDVPLLSIIYE